MKTPIYTGLLQSELDATGYRIFGLPTPFAGNDAATKDYVDAHGGGTVVSPDGSHQVTATELLNSIPGTRTPIATLATGLGNYFDSQSFDPSVIVNPNDSTQLIMFFSGMAAPVKTGQDTIGRATASIYDPTVWTVSASAVLTPSLGWETGGDGLRCATALYNPDDSKIYLFYTYGEQNVGLATSTDLGLTWTKLGIVLSPSGSETYVSHLSVIREGTTLHGIYCYRDASTVLAGFRYASASTSNWTTWTKSGSDIYTAATRYNEFHHFLKVGSTYLLAFENAQISPPTPFEIWFLSSSSPSSGWTLSANTPWMTKSGVAGTFDRYHVATPHLMIINGYWYLIYCGALDHDNPYDTNHWQMGITPLLTPFQVSQLYIGPDLRLVSITGGGKMQARDPSTGLWVDADQWTNP